jgi:hypothetical protein
MILIVWTACCAPARAAEVFLRLKVVQPAEGSFSAEVSGYRHEDPWYLPTIQVQTTGGTWSGWIDLSKWPLHGRLDRAGGIAEWPSLRVTIARTGDKPAIQTGAVAVQIADRADENAIVHAFTESSGSNVIAFLLPTPLREHAREFETGSQMTARHLAWAKQATRDQAIELKDFTFITALWGHYDPGLARQEIEALKLLGFNVVGNYDARQLSDMGVGTYATIWNYSPDSTAMDNDWAKASLHANAQATHYVIGDEVQTLNFASADRAKLNAWFRDYLRAKSHASDADLPSPIGQIEYPAQVMLQKSLPRDADLPTRRLMYHAAKLGQWWSARQLRHASDLIRTTLPGMKTETLPSDHGFFYAWGPPHIGMSYRMLDLFELGAQRAVDQLSAEDWLGLNHMYGPTYTWTGAQSFEYFTSICRSATSEAPPANPMMLRGLITVSDDRYLRLKAYSALGQGAKSFFFWTFGPTYIGTENYWSDLQSEYDGIAKLGRAIAKAEPVIDSAKVVRDPVAVLYSVSHDIWHSDDSTAFVEKRLLWHALRHLHVQPDFLREEDVEAGRLKDYKVLYVTDWCISRAASERINQWVRDGGVVYLSAGAATRDEYYEPFIPEFAATAWPADATATLQQESHQYNERVDLPTIKPMTSATIQLASRAPFDLAVLGCRGSIKSDHIEPIARFADGSTAGTIQPYGRGKVIAFAFLPMLAYGQGANFKPQTLAEQWPAAPRQLPKIALDAAGITPAAACDHPVVETSLLTGAKGSALMLVNYTYRPIDSLAVDLKLSDVRSATSIDGKPVKVEKTAEGIRLRLRLDWTDIILLR